MRRRGILSPAGGGQGVDRRLYWFTMLLAVSSLSLSAQADRKYIRKGNGNYNDGSYKQAEIEYRKALENNPSSNRADYNLGNSLYKQGQFDAAAGRYNSLITSGSQTERTGHTERSRSETANPGHTERSRSATTASDLSRYYYNLGNAHFQSQKYRESIEAYKMSLRNNPSDLDAKHNLQLAQKLMHEAEQQQQQGGSNQENKDKEQQKQQQQQQAEEQQNKNQQQNQDQSQSNQDQQEDDRQQQNQSQDHPDYKGINPQDAERILNALENQEKQTLKDVQDKKAIRHMEVEKNW